MTPAADAALPPAASDAAAASLLAQLADDGPIRARLLIVAAHPDDEALMLGGQLWRLRDALLLHVTDGAPRDGADARQHGFAAIADYAAARRRELHAALAAGEAAGLRRATLDIPDREAFCDLAGLSRRVADWLCRDRPAAVLTHVYEGGHPDHDAAAFAVQAGCRLMPPEQRPEIIEMPLYHAAADGRMVREFLPGRHGGTVVRLGEEERRRKARMVGCFATQRDLLARFDLDPEYFRQAPAYEFRRPPHPGALLYESWGWGITGAAWRHNAAAALAALGLD